MPENTIIGTILEFHAGEINLAELAKAKGSEFFKRKDGVAGKFANIAAEVMKLGASRQAFLPICDSTTTFLLEKEAPRTLHDTLNRIGRILDTASENPETILKNLGLSKDDIKRDPRRLPEKNRSESMMSFLIFGNTRPLNSMDKKPDMGWQKICEQWIIDFEPGLNHLKEYFGSLLKNLFSRNAPSEVWDTLIQPGIDTKDQATLDFLSEKGGSELYIGFSKARIESIIEAYHPEFPRGPNAGQDFWKQYAQKSPEKALEKLPEQLSAKEAKESLWVLEQLTKEKPDEVFQRIKHLSSEILISDDQYLYFITAACLEHGNTATINAIIAKLENFIKEGNISQIWGVFWQQLAKKGRKAEGLKLLKSVIKTEGDIAYLSGTDMTPVTYSGHELLRDYPELIIHSRGIVPKANWERYPVFFEDIDILDGENQRPEKEDASMLVV